jgi:hypothetical protein
MRLVAEASDVGDVTQDQIASWRQGCPFKLELAAKLRVETTVTVWFDHPAAGDGNPRSLGAPALAPRPNLA